MKRCGQCGHFREGSEYAKNKTRPDGLQGECRQCRKKMSARYKRGTYRNPSRQQELRRLWKYGLTACDMARMRIAQSDACAICGASGELHIDHSHQDGTVRGLLCGSCNRGLGQFRDDPARLTAALAYLGA